MFILGTRSRRIGAFLATATNTPHMLQKKRLNAINKCTYADEMPVGVRAAYRLLRASSLRGFLGLNDPHHFVGIHVILKLARFPSRPQRLVVATGARAGAVTFGHPLRCLAIPSQKL